MLFKRGFTLIETMITIAIYGILVLAVIYIINTIIDRRNYIIEHNYTLYETKLLGDYDKLVCYKKEGNSEWDNRVITNKSKKICDTFNRDNDIKDYVITLKNIGIKQYYTILYIYKKDKDLLYSISVTDDNNFIPDKNDSVLFHSINKTYKVKDYNGVFYISFSRTNTKDYIKNFVFIDKTFLNN